MAAEEYIFSSLSSPTTNAPDMFNNIVLQPGWNLVPWPYTFAANITNTVQSKMGSVWLLTGSGGWTAVTQFKPYGGYAIYNKTGGSITVGSALSWSAIAKAVVPADFADWQIRFEIESGKYKDAYNFIGASDSCRDGSDNFDEPKPPAIGKGISLFFTPGKLSRDMRSSAVDGNLWDFEVDNSADQSSITMRWELTAKASGDQMRLVDVSNNQFIDMSSAAQYSFRTHSENKFKVIVGTADFVQSQITKLKSELPQSFALAPNYPNPFNPQTQIRFDIAKASNVKLKVYNILGQEVTTLINQFYNTGRYSVTWNGKDTRGLEAASGVYIYRLETEGFSKSRKMLLIK
jgi:hypothetical protein